MRFIVLGEWKKNGHITKGMGIFAQNFLAWKSTSKLKGLRYHARGDFNDAQ